MHINFATVFVLLISGTNLYCLAYALFLNEQGSAAFQLTRIKLKWAARMSIILTFLSQTLYLVFLAAWLFHWVCFYPGAPVYRVVPTGFALSFFGLVAALLGTSPKNWVSFMVSLTTASLWIIAGVVSVAA